jgi:hypothetical protein
VNDNTVLAIAFLITGTLLNTTALTTMVPSAFADNKQKAEDDSAAAIADCDDNDVEEARFLCIALATNDVEIETEPPEEEPGEGLVVCKVVENPPRGVEPFDFRFIAISSDTNTQFQGGPPGDPGPSCSEIFFVGEYDVTEDTVGSDAPLPDRVEVEGDCTQDPNNPQRATGEVEEGETEECTFTNIYEGGDS